MLSGARCCLKSSALPPPCANATKGYLTTKPETDEHDLEDDDDDND